MIAFVATPFLYNHAIALAVGQIADPEGYSRSDRKARNLHHILELVGANGVLAIGALAIAILGYIIWKRYSNPPSQTQLTRQS